MAVVKANPVEAFLTEQHQICCESLRHYARRASRQDLHRLRVAIKKIKAILTISYELFGIDRHSFFAPYSLLFDEAGIIREATLILDRIAELSTDHQAVVTRTKHISTLKAAFKKNIPEYLKTMDYALPYTQGMLRSYEFDMSAYCHHLHRRLRKKWHKTSQNSEYHSLRRLIKRFLYAASLLSTDETKKIISAKDLKRLDKLQDLIGRWHDDIDLVAQPLHDVSDREVLLSMITKETQKIRHRIIKRAEHLWG